MIDDDDIAKHLVRLHSCSCCELNKTVKPMLPEQWRLCLQYNHTPFGVTPEFCMTPTPNSKQALLVIMVLQKLVKGLKMGKGGKRFLHSSIGNIKVC